MIAGEEASEPIALTYSELAAYRACGFAYRLRHLLGFEPFLAAELGYGKAVHHIMREVAEHTLRTGQVPDKHQLDQMFDRGFFLPAASKPAHRQLKDAARTLVDNYLTKHGDDLQRIWETERPMELHLPSAIISGRADVILDKENGQIQSLAIVDYKTSTEPDPVADDEYRLQLAVYADAGRREGLNVQAAYLHDLSGDRKRVDVSPESVEASEQIVESTVRSLQMRDFHPSPGYPCQHCDLQRARLLP